MGHALGSQSTSHYSNAHSFANAMERDIELRIPRDAKRSIGLFDLSNADEMPSAGEISGEPEADNFQR